MMQELLDIRVYIDLNFPVTCLLPVSTCCSAREGDTSQKPLAFDLLSSVQQVRHLAHVAPHANVCQWDEVACRVKDQKKKIRIKIIIKQ